MWPLELPSIILKFFTSSLGTNKCHLVSYVFPSKRDGEQSPLQCYFTVSITSEHSNQHILPHTSHEMWQQKVRVDDTEKIWPSHGINSEKPQQHHSRTSASHPRFHPEQQRVYDISWGIPSGQTCHSRLWRNTTINDWFKELIVRQCAQIGGVGVA